MLHQLRASTKDFPLWIAAGIVSGKCRCRNHELLSNQSNGTLHLMHHESVWFRIGIRLPDLRIKHVKINMNIDVSDTRTKFSQWLGQALLQSKRSKLLSFHDQNL